MVSKRKYQDTKQKKYKTNNKSTEKKFEEKQMNKVTQPHFKYF